MTATEYKVHILFVGSPNNLLQHGTVAKYALRHSSSVYSFVTFVDCAKMVKHYETFLLADSTVVLVCSVLILPAKYSSKSLVGHRQHDTKYL